MRYDSAIPTIHFTEHQDADGFGRHACNRRRYDTDVIDVADPRNVDCKRCRRTKAYRVAQAREERVR